MGIGQHYNQAAYIGKYFSYLPQDKNLSFRQYKIETLNLKQFFNLKSPTPADILQIIKPKPAEKLFSSGQIISLQTEIDFKINELENQVFKLLDRDLLFDSSNKDYETIIDYFSLHEARSLSSYLTMRKGLYIGIFKKKKTTVNGLAQYVSGFEMFPKNSNKITLEINNEIQNVIQQNSDAFFEIFAKKIFNLLYPKIWKNKKNKYLHHRAWFSFELNPEDSIGFGTTPIIDFSSPQHANISEFNLFQQLPINIQEIIKNSVIIVEKKQMISMGIDISKSKIKKLYTDFFATIKKDHESLLKLLNFLSLYSIFTSHDYIIIAGEKQKKIFSLILSEHFNDIKKFYINNVNETTISGKFKYGKMELKDLIDNQVDAGERELNAEEIKNFWKEVPNNIQLFFGGKT